MQRHTIRYLLIIGIFLAGIGGILLTRPDVFSLRPAGRGNTWVVDVDTWRRTPAQRVVISPYDFHVDGNLHTLPMQLGDWQGTDVPQTNIEVFILLEPEEYLQRRYTRPDGSFLWLSLIGSRKVRSFHPTEICYISDGWSTEVTSADVPLRKGSLKALQVRAQKESWEHLVLYFYIWPDFRDLSRGVVMFKVTAPITRSEGETLELERAFIREIFWEAMDGGG